MKRKLQDTVISRFVAASVTLVLVLVPFHAFLTVWLSSGFGHYTVLRLWPEVVLAIILGVVCAWFVRDKEFRQHFLRSLLFKLILAYITLNIGIGLIALFKHGVGSRAFAYGLVINLRPVLWLLGVWALSYKTQLLEKKWPRLIMWPLIIVCIFAILQALILPHNFLSHFGYIKGSTISPATTLNQATDTTRAQSTLRGPNPLGAYLGFAFFLLLAVPGLNKKSKVLTGGLIAFALYLSFSRSAWLGFVASAAVLVYVTSRNKRRLWIGATAAVLLSAGFIAIFHNNPSVQNVILHNRDNSGIVHTSNVGHASALEDTFTEIIDNPLGSGTGTSGYAGVYNTGHNPRNTESYLLSLAVELGVLGLVVFGTILAVIARELYRRRGNRLAIVMFATLIGSIFVNLLSYAWTDETLVFVWWGLVGIVLTMPKAKQG